MKAHVLYTLTLLSLIACKKTNVPVPAQEEQQKVVLDLTLIQAMSYKRLAHVPFDIYKTYRHKNGRNEVATVYNEKIGVAKSDQYGRLTFQYPSNTSQIGHITLKSDRYTFKQAIALNKTKYTHLFNDTIGLIQVHLNPTNLQPFDTLYVETEKDKFQWFNGPNWINGLLFTTSRFKSYGQSDTLIYAKGYAAFMDAREKQKKGMQHNNKVVFEVNGWPKTERIVLTFE